MAHSRAQHIEHAERHVSQAEPHDPGAQVATDQFPTPVTARPSPATVQLVVIPFCLCKTSANILPPTLITSLVCYCFNYRGCICRKSGMKSAAIKGKCAA